jgi:hypothetical protein
VQHQTILPYPCQPHVPYLLESTFSDIPASEKAVFLRSRSRRKVLAILLLSDLKDTASAISSHGRYIRLLRLLPGQPSHGLQVEIYTVFGSRRSPEYEALSYVWGSTEDKRDIMIEGLSRNTIFTIPSKTLRRRSREVSVQRIFVHQKKYALAVTQNLEIALRHLRRGRETRVFWIDAICINQNDLSERSIEVARMGAIFSKARRVVVWLGPQRDDSNLAMETFRRIGHDISYDYTQSMFTTLGSPSDFLRNNPQALLQHEASWTAVKNLLNRKWFNRLWVIQEVKLAAAVVMVVGHSELSLDIFLPRVTVDMVICVRITRRA